MSDQLKVLFPTDFSPNSKIALRLLKLLQTSYKVDPFLIHVIPSFWKDWVSSGMYKKEALQRLKSWQLALVEKQDTKRLHIEYGNPADIILQTVERKKYNLIVLGSKTIATEGRYKTGTTVEAVTRHAKKSIWIVKKDTISKIVCGIDGSASSAKALQFAIELSHRFSASLCIVSAIPHNDFNPLGMSESAIKKQEDKFKTEQVRKLEKFLKRFDFSGISLKKSFPSGTPASMILDMAEDFNYDLIVIGAKGHSILRHVLIGTTTEKILRYLPCSLLVVR